MIKRILISTIILYFLSLLETSFFVHFNVFRWIPSTLLLYVVIFNVLESPKKNAGIYVSLIAGFLSDIFSSSFIGFNIIIFLAVSLLLKFVFNRYVRLPFFEKT
jgi:rod shape-determining protein MreD